MPILMGDGYRVVLRDICYLVAEESLSTVYELESDSAVDANPATVQLLSKIGRCCAAWTSVNLKHCCLMLCSCAIVRECDCIRRR